MTRAPFKAKRDSTERPIVDALEEAGATVMRMNDPFDLLVAYRGKLTLIEVKKDAATARKLTDGPAPRSLTDTERKQRETISALAHHRVHVPVVYTVDQALAAIGVQTSFVRPV